MNTLKTGLAGLMLLGLSACQSTPGDDETRTRYEDSASRYITLETGTFHYKDEGEGPVIVLLHGTASSLHTWNAWSQDLTADYRVIRPDLPGSGLSAPAQNGQYEAEDDVRFLKHFLETRPSAGPVHLVGSSLGGRIAWEYALSYPDQVKSLTLINALGYPQESWPPGIQMAQWPVFDQLMVWHTPRWIYAQSLKDIYHDPAQITEPLIDRYYDLARWQDNPQAFVDRVKARLDQDSDRISGIRVPTLVLWGEEDPYFPVENAYRFAEDIPGAQLSTFSDVAHLPMEEAPAKSVARFRRFLNGQ